MIQDDGWPNEAGDSHLLMARQTPTMQGTKDPKRADFAENQDWHCQEVVTAVVDAVVADADDDDDVDDVADFEVRSMVVNWLRRQLQQVVVV